jgi:hypothetical protein
MSDARSVVRRLSSPFAMMLLVSGGCADSTAPIDARGSAWGTASVAVGRSTQAGAGGSAS